MFNKFIKLSTMVINTSAIKNIRIDKNKYFINFISTDINGTILFGSGGISTDDDSISVCEIKNPQDYKIITDWIDSTCNSPSK